VSKISNSKFSNPYFSISLINCSGRSFFIFSYISFFIIFTLFTMFI